MEHRQLFRTSPVLETDHDQNRNLIHSSMHLGSSGAADNGSFAFHMDNMLPGGENVSSDWNSALRSNEYVSSSIIPEPTYYSAPVPGPSYPGFQHLSAARSFRPVTQNYAERPSSSSYYSASPVNHYRHLTYGHEGGSTSSATGNERGPYSRKRPAASVIHESTGYHSVGSSSDVSIPSLEKPSSGSQRWPWEVVSVAPSNRGSSLSTIEEASQRNVRSRSTLDLDVNHVRACALSNPSHYSQTTGRLIDRPHMLSLGNLSVTANTRDWSHNPVPSDGLTRYITGPCTSSHDTNLLRLGSGGTIGSLDIDSYHHHLISSRNPVVPSHNLPSSTQIVRGGRSSHVRRAIPACRVTRSHQRSGYVATSSERVLPSVPESYSPSYSRPIPMIGWRNSDRSGRLRIPYQRSSPLSGATDSHDRLGYMMMEHSTMHDPRNLLDQHRDMRLDVDNMSYEELLALEERIGNVSTGLSEDTMSKCLRERVHYPSDHIEESTCVICLEEYKSKDVVATLANCSHDYHTGCIKKWLSMKKVCPICKAPVLEDS
ncbi:E3 ubiquitin-protein ligase mbr2 [Thalictrum thalictroides]|uniref:RING-type E3 ubiquitin transferase n=1 Tax=Thalictrum thalictroides TaxID=46969 RepID=A0A7J6XFF8_THATH|nr:E3 ubiquitin-protein ligase mbr2 [Thalictrum thalictroides]